MSGRIRCAIYTRKSSEEGLEQSFNSLDAQREACEAFIRAQKHEGWVALNTLYDDGGFSGGNIDRPALKKLIDDIGQGKINTVVVYKVDRLTRSLADFAKIIEQFDAKQVSFVSVTQQFNTTSSMGRLTLNVLLSFAQFEREVTGERIRDKIAASKAKGMWMGGCVPLGYDLRERRIYINPDEAMTVRLIFDEYIRLGTVPALMSYLNQIGVQSKIRIAPSGAKTGGKYYSRGALYKLLRNHLYVGEIEHKRAIHAGEHQGIIERELWDNVQLMLDENRNGKRERPRTSSSSMLTGLLFDDSGVRYIPTHAQKGGRRFHYYTSQAVIRGSNERRPINRLPAPALESAVADRIQAFFNCQGEIIDAFKESGLFEHDRERTLNAAERIASSWSRMARAVKADLIRTIVHRVVVHEAQLVVELKLGSTIRLLNGAATQIQAETDRIETISLTMQFRHIPQGKALKLVIGNDTPDDAVSRDAIAKAIARVRSWCDLIVEGQASSLLEIGRQHGLMHCYVKNIFPLASLGPEAIEFLLNSPGSQTRTLRSLMRKLPINWSEQRSLLGAE